MPELFIVLIFTGLKGIDPILCAVAIIITVVLAEVLGFTTLYTIVTKKKEAIPVRVKRWVEKYHNFLLCSDERIILVNRIAPVLPLLGAFVALCGWSYRKSISYLMLGGVIKYGAILALSSFFIYYFQEKDLAITVSMLMVISVMVISFILSIYKNKKILKA